MDKDDIVASVLPKVTVQDYSPAPAIEGVKWLDLKQFTDCSGTFMELVRLNKGEIAGDGLELKQINFSTLEPGVIKAWHLHYKQDELWFVPPASRLLVGLYDVRAKSKTNEVNMRLVLGSHKTRLLYIPAGVAHGLANLSTQTATLIYLISQQFNLEQPDEQRLPWDILGAEFWEMKRE